MGPILSYLKLAFTRASHRIQYRKGFNEALSRVPNWEEEIVPHMRPMRENTQVTFYTF